MNATHRPSRYAERFETFPMPHPYREGGRVRSLISLLSYLGSGQYRERHLGVKIPPTNLQEHQLQQARGFADTPADRLPETATGGGSRY